VPAGLLLLLVEADFGFCIYKGVPTRAEVGPSLNHEPGARMEQAGWGWEVENWKIDVMVKVNNLYTIIKN
jgi:hypothetical protein